MDGRNHSGRTRQDECESTEAATHTRVREKARVRERVPDGLRPDVRSTAAMNRSEFALR